VPARTALIGTAVALALAGCGGDEEEARTVTVPPDPFLGEVGEGALSVEGSFSAREVKRAYAARIGLLLRVDRREPGRYVTLTPVPGPRFAPAAPDLGIFTLYVAESDAEARALAAGDKTGEERLPQAEPNVRFYSSGTLTSARAVFGNVVVDWNLEDPSPTVTDERFQRLIDPLESLSGGDVPERPGMEACLDLGIDPVTGEEGTCLLFPQTVTFADSDAALDFGGLEVSLAGPVELATELPHRREDLSVGPDPPKPPQPVRAKGEFVIVRVELANGGREPLEGLRAGLVVDGVLFHPDLDNAFYVDETNPPFTLEVGDSGELVLLFDLPADVAAAAETSGSLVLVDPRNGRTLDLPGNAPTVARLRLNP
jgi:hypothetical protein